MGSERNGGSEVTVSDEEVREGLSVKTGSCGQLLPQRADVRTK